jgi:hypothetical protein
MNKTERRKIHRAINDLTHDEVAEIVRKAHPRAKGARIDELAKAAIAEAHKLVSPRT